MRQADPGSRPLESEEMRRRYQSPEPVREGKWWYLRLWETTPKGKRKRNRLKLAPASTPVRKVKRIADEVLYRFNQEEAPAGPATTFREYVERTYIPTMLPLLAKTTRDCYEGMITKYLEPNFGAAYIRDLNPLVLQRHFSGMAKQGVPFPTIVKIRDTLSSVLRSAVDYGVLNKNPMKALRLPPDKRGRRPKPFITPEQFAQIVEMMPEPYATMTYVAVWTGLRVSELIGLKWRCIHDSSITIEERYCRGDWSSPKTEASAATIGVTPMVIQRIQRLKTLTVTVQAGRATRRYKVVKADGPDNLVFQSVKQGKPMRDGNVLRRFLKPAARAIGLQNVNWRCLRTSHATWLIQAGADPKSVQAQMRHTRIAMTLDVYAQMVPEAQRNALQKLASFAEVAESPNLVHLVQ